MIGVRLVIKDNTADLVFDKLPERFNEIVRETLKRTGAFLETRVKANVPEDTGELKRSVRFRLEETGGGNFELRIIAGAPYAFRMHEELTPAGRLQLGPGSRAKASQGAPEGGPGGKYLERVVNFHTQQIIDNLGRNLDRNIPNLRGSIRVSPLSS